MSYWQHAPNSISPDKKLSSIQKFTIWATMSEKVPSDMLPAKIQISLLICSLIRIFTRTILDTQGCQVSSCRKQRLWPLCRCAGWLESSLSTHVTRYFFSYSALSIWTVDPDQTPHFKLVLLHISTHIRIPNVFLQSSSVGLLPVTVSRC